MDSQPGPRPSLSPRPHGAHWEQGSSLVTPKSNREEAQNTMNDLYVVNCDCVAHAGNVEERNWQCRKISGSLFSKNKNPYGRPVQVTVWLGDLNYRVHGIDTQPARNLIHKNLHRVSTVPS